MATNYPSGLDSLSNPAGTDALSTGHAAQHGNANDAIEAIEGELGLNPRGGSATVKARFDAIEANGWVTNARVADNTVTDAKLNQGWVTFSDASVVCAATTRKLAQTGTMSASRSVTLPAANAVSAGTEIVIADESGSVTTTNTIVVTRAGSDTINGAASVSIGAAYGWRRLISDGSSKWSVDSGVIRMSDTGTITSTMIADGTIANADLADGAVSPIKVSGGYVAKTALYTATNDDRVIDCTTGTYTITLPTAASQAGRRFFIRNSGTGTITIGRTGAETIAGATSQALAGYGFLEVVSDGTNWLVSRGQYASETIGRRIFTWNHAYSTGGGWQMTYGDTGWRDISALATNFGSGFLYLRRVNDRVSIITNGLVIAAGQVGTNIDGTIIVAHTSGFEPAYIGIESQAIINQSGGYWQQVATYNSASDIRVRRMHRMGADYPTTWASGGALYLEKSYSTTVSWPTSLPGSAAGSIPT